jgi:large subunit ribosomal protein L22
MTEKNYNPNQKESKAMKKQPIKAEKNILETKPKVEEEKIEETKANTTEVPTTEKEEKKTEDKKTKDEKKEIKKSVKKIKKEEVYVNAKSIPVSTKYSMNICKFIKGKRIGDAIRDLEQVMLLKKAVPMKGEYSHRKGKGMSGGAFPQRAAGHFIVLLKSLAGNANNHEINEPIIVEASANWAPAPRGRFGRVKRKRTHITLRAIEIKIKDKKNKKSEEKKVEDKK